MPEPPLRQLVVWAAGLAVIVALGVILLQRSSSAASSPGPAAAVAPIPVQDESGGPGGRVFVHVAGAVRKPGVYTLRAGARVADAVERAGGARASADLSAVNLASKLEDGRQVLVPRRVGGGVTAAVAPSGVAAAPAQPVDLNTATLEQLDTLDGVGPATAQKIVDYRTEHGGFGSVDELGQVPGIGEKRLAALRDHVRV
jgi:competence protein ComEA